MIHEKGKSSRANQNAPPYDKVSYAHHYDNTINMVSRFDDIINFIIIKDKNKKQSSNVVTQGQASKVILPGLVTNSDHATMSSSLPKYNLVD